LEAIAEHVRRLVISPNLGRAVSEIRIFAIPLFPDKTRST